MKQNLIILLLCAGIGLILAFLNVFVIFDLYPESFINWFIWYFFLAIVFLAWIGGK